MAEQIQPLAGEVEAAVRAAMAEVLPPELAAEDPLVRRSDRADYQANAALSLARRLGRNPRELAGELRDKVSGAAALASVEVSGPGFLNITLSDAALLGRLAARAADPRLGVPAGQAGETAVIDYSAPNVAKEMHVGHLRSTLIGDALARVLGFLGAKVVRQNHVGDWGTQFGMLIQYLFEHPEAAWRGKEVGQGETAGAVSALDALYRTARQEFDADPEFKQRAQRRVVALQAGDEETVAAWREIVGESETAFQQIYERLGVLLTLDDVLGESFYNPWLQEVVDELREKGILRDSEGAKAVFFDDQPVPLLVQKTDGGFGYAATDLATIRYSIRELKGTRLVYVVDARQSQHFQMIFETARRAGWLTEGVRAVHAANGTINGPDGRPFKTRSGGTVRLADLLDDALRRAREVVAEKDPGLGAEELDAIAHVASIGAVKYAELSTSRTKDYSFDVDRMVSFNGQTGVYLQYTHTRIASIIRKAGEQGAETARFDTGLALEPAEHALALELDEFGAALDAVAETLEPHQLATYLYALAKAFTTFYESCPVLKEGVPAGVRANRLALCGLTRETLAQGLALLGIEAPDRM
ncbi:arginine--tRNA ligase [Streptomyces sp. MP131-18]|uniref:arginine--tRNA ligase n=1 Tax=Streptomyces sp. MP131-18 TaxID=1857892 RepID=UPI00097BD1BE|nr:arginine--tRNA ligase [Streptomyces sp. MP131-18]ONK14786.1 Arginine--tRNA ligase [Streptomyces sp. MP131-18]